MPPRMAAEIDFEAEGLLRGTRGRARDSRRRLLAELAADGVPLEELRQAVAEDRLALLPVERVLSGGAPRFTSDEVAERTGVPREFLDRQWQALGLAIPAEGEAAFTAEDVEAAKRIALLRAAGLPDDGILEIVRLLGMTMSQLAAANRRLIAEAFLLPGDTEHEAATRLAQAAEGMRPMIAASLGYVLDLHLREQLRHDTAGFAAIASGSVARGETVTVCFADLVDFTQLGESLPPEALGEVTGRFTELAADAVSPPVRLVKLIGDAAMLVGPEPGEVVEAALALVEASEAEGEDFPLLRAGVAGGEALQRTGDWYGRPVNLASRITAIARPGSVLAAAEVHDALADEYAWSFAGARRLKGIEGQVELFRCRRLDGERPTVARPGGGR